MERSTKAATVTATTELGEFTAIAAAYTVDRVGDQIIPGAFAKTIAHWQASGKRVPLHWDHQGEAHNVIGSLDPANMKEVDAGLQVSGRVDLENSETAREAWRSMKNGSMSLSFGYLVTQATKRKSDGINELREIDLFEVSIVPAPANPDTRILSMKSAAEQREEAARVEREVEQIQIPDVPAAPPAPEEPEIDLAHELQEVKSQLAETRELLEDLRKKADETDKEPQARSVDPLRKQAEAVALEFASDGQSLRRPPKTVEQKPPEPSLSLRELKQRTRDEMLGVLSGGTIE